MSRIQLSARRAWQVALRCCCALVISSGSMDAAEAPKLTYDDHVRPVFENKCFSCHNPDKAKGGLDLTTYTAAMAGGSSGEIVVAGAPNDSRLYKSLARLAEPYMPPEGDPLGKDKLDIVSAWIAGGLLENKGSKARKAQTGLNVALAKPSTGKPDGPPPMPEHLALEPVVATPRAFAPADIAASPWAPLLALAAPKQVLLYNSDSLALAGVLEFPEGFPENLAFSRSGQLVIAGGGRGGKLGKVVGWDVRTGRRAFELGNEFDSVLATDISADHALVALGGPSRRVKVYSTQTGEELLNIKKHTDWVTALSFSPDGVLLASGDRNGGLFVWESGTGNLFYTLKAHSAAITAVSWRADSNILATASEDGSVRLWEMNGGKQVKNWTAHAGGVTDMAFTGNGHIVSSGRDKHARVWDSNGTQKSASKDFADIPVTACLTHDGARFVAADWSGAVKVFASADGKLLGAIAANPPTIGSMLQRAASELSESERASAESQRIEADLSQALSEAKAVLEAAASAHGAAVKNHAAMEAALQAANGAAGRHADERDAAMAAQQAAAQRIEQLRAEIGAAAPDATKAEELKAQLAVAEATLPAHSELVLAKQSAHNSAQATAAAAKDQMASALAALTAASEKQEAAAADHASKGEAQNTHRSALQAGAEALAKARSRLQFWQAAELNLKRHRRAAERSALSDSVEEADAEAQQAGEAHAAIAGKLAKAELRAAAALEAVAMHRTALEAANEELPALQSELDRANQELAAADHEMTIQREALAQAGLVLANTGKKQQVAKDALAVLDGELSAMHKQYLAALPRSE